MVCFGTPIILLCQGLPSPVLRAVTGTDGAEAIHLHRFPWCHVSAYHRLPCSGPGSQCLPAESFVEHCSIPSRHVGDLCLSGSAYFTMRYSQILPLAEDSTPSELSACPQLADSLSPCVCSKATHGPLEPWKHPTFFISQRVSK